MGSNLDFGIISLIHRRLGCTPALLKPCSRGQLPSSNFKIGKSNIPTNLPSFSKYYMNVYPLYKILADFRNMVTIKTDTFLRDYKLRLRLKVF